MKLANGSYVVIFHKVKLLGNSKNGKAGHSAKVKTILFERKLNIVHAHGSLTYFFGKF